MTSKGESSQSLYMAWLKIDLLQLEKIEGDIRVTCVLLNFASL
jgi:hypothetical protein